MVEIIPYGLMEISLALLVRLKVVIYMTISCQRQSNLISLSIAHNVKEIYVCVKIFYTILVFENFLYNSPVNSNKNFQT